MYGNNLFTTLHLLKVYHQIEVLENSRKKTGFTTQTRLFQYICLTFGRTNAPASFQRLLKHILRDYITKFLILYTDNILVFSATFEDRLSHVAQVLQIIRESYLKVPIDKSQFAWNSVELNHLITPERIRPNTKNIVPVTSFLTPAKIKIHLLLCWLLSLLSTIY